VLSTINDTGSVSPEKLVAAKGFDTSNFFNEDDDEEENFVVIRNLLTKIIVNDK